MENETQKAPGNVIITVSLTFEPEQEPMVAIRSKVDGKEIKGLPMVLLLPGLAGPLAVTSGLGNPEVAAAFAEAALQAANKLSLSLLAASQPQETPPQSEGGSPV